MGSATLDIKISDMVAYSRSHHTTLADHGIKLIFNADI